jgi:hypothetical protein
MFQWIARVMSQEGRTLQVHCCDPTFPATDLAMLNLASLYTAREPAGGTAEMQSDMSECRVKLAHGPVSGSSPTGRANLGFKLTA